MHIAQQAASQMRKRQPTKGSWLAPPTPTSPARPSTSAGTLSSSNPSPVNGSKVSLIQAGETEINVDQARWFLMLPDKVRKQQFSTAEQVALMRRCKTVLEDVSPEMAADVYRRLLKFSREDRDRPASRPRPSTSDECIFDDEKSHLTTDTWLDSNTDDADWEVDMLRRYSKPLRSSLEDEVKSSTAPTPMVTADDMFNMVSIPPPPPSPDERDFMEKAKRLSFKRRHSLTPLPLPPPTLAPPVPAMPPVPAISSDPVRHFALSAKQARPSVEQAPALLEPPKKYYADNAARIKLRTALSSSEKFDEMLAFGLSPTVERNNSTSTNSSFENRQPGLYHSEQEDDDAKSVETLSPSTPTYNSDTQSSTKQPSFDSGVDFSYIQSTRPKTSHGSPAGSIGNRQMTIHMTLTRQDLRSPNPEEQIYSTQRLQTTGVEIEKVDPLALQPLYVSDDSSGAHGAFAISENGLPKGLKRVWRSLTKH